MPQYVFALQPEGLLLWLSWFESLQQNLLQCKSSGKEQTALLYFSIVWLSEEQTLLFILHQIHLCITSVALHSPFPDLICFGPSSFPHSSCSFSHSYFFCPLLLAWRACKQTSLPTRANSLSRRSAVCVSSTCTCVRA